MKNVQLPKPIVTRLEERINDEYTAHFFYRNAANFCENVGYLAAADFFYKEADSELEHAKKVQKFLLDWNVQPNLKNISSPEPFKDLIEVIQKSYIMEYDLLESYNEDAVFFLKESNISAFNLATSFVEHQTESVAEYATLKDKLELINSADKSWLYQFQLEEFEA